MAYQEMIEGRLGAWGLRNVDPRHVEAWMRVEHPTLDGLSPTDFDVEVRAAVRCTGQATTEQSEDLAQSFGL